MVDMIDGGQLRSMIRYGNAALLAEKQSINDLNVFPVPDGDTGTNMSMTIGAAVTALAGGSGSVTVGEVTSVTASAMLRGARGNSGVILSLLFRGIGRALKNKEKMDGVDFAAALSEGVSAAYGAVMKPAEGTILTVSRLAAERAAEVCMEDSSFQYVLEQTIARGEEALADTVNQNPVLKKAGVVDAGGKGFVVILTGMLAFLRGEAMAETQEAAPEVREKADFAEFDSQDTTFAFDTVYIVRKATPDVDLNPLREYLNSIGDSLVIGEDDESFKVHVHTNTPGDALNESQKYGTLELAKIENMRTQQEALAAGRKAQSTDDLEKIEEELEQGAYAEPERVIAPNEKKYGFVAVCAGEGLEAVFTDLGVDGMVSGGQTMNPSTEDLMKVIDATPAEIVFVLPNNKNIIMAAQQCIPLSDTKKVVVIETKTVPQGIAAMMAVDLEADEAELTETMLEAARRVRTAQITYAARDSDLDGFNIKAGEYLALMESKLHGSSPEIRDLLRSLARTAEQSKAEFITLFSGADVTEDEAVEAEAIFAELCPCAEIAVIPGGQPVYYYLISIE